MPSRFTPLHKIRDGIAIPIMLLTVKEHTSEEVEQLGVAGYLRKPFHQKELLSKIEELLGNTDNDAPSRK
jgi:DNA-binding response OmpR family regulator